MRILVARGLATMAALAAGVSCGSSDQAALFGASGGSGAGGGGGKSAAGGAAGQGGAGAQSAGAAGAQASGGTTTGGAAGGTSEGDAAADGDAGDSGGSAGADGGATGGSGGSSCAFDWCFDSDRDQHGNPETRQSSCARPGDGWLMTCDDCHDENPSVHPQATTCHGEPYTARDGATLSFDYDCDDKETECENNPRAASSCGFISLQCSGSGYLSNQNRPVSGDQQNAFCGSERWRQCSQFTTFCNAQNQTQPAIACL